LNHDHESNGRPICTAPHDGDPGGYTLVFGGLLLLGARAGDLLGRRRVFIFGVAVFALASLLVGVAPTGCWLIAARAVQGIAAGRLGAAPQPD
jgi:MFS family permease